MSNAENYNKHLSLDDRITIQNLLDSNVNLTAIGKALGKHRTCSSFGSSCQSCPDYEEPACERRDRSPFVCNGCPNKNKCRYTRWFYSASLAHKEYLYMLSLKELPLTV